MNKARLTYRFDRTGLKEEGTQTAAPKEPWYRDGEPEEARGPIQEPRPTHGASPKGGDSPFPAEWRSEQEREAAASERRREREEELRRGRQEAWEWSDSPQSRRSEAGQPSYGAYKRESGHAPRRDEAEPGPSRSGKVVPLYDEEWMSHEPTRRYPSDPTPGERSRAYEEETYRIESLIRETEQRARRDRDHYSYESREHGPGGSESTPPASRRYPDSRVSEDRYGSPDEYGPSKDYGPSNDYESSRDYEPPRSYGSPGRYSDYPRPEIEESLLYPEARRVRRRNLAWLKVTASLAGALLVGGMLGYYVLTLFNGSSVKDDAAPTGSSGAAIVQTDPVKEGASAPDSASTGGDSAAAAAQANVSIPEKTFVLLQNGKFTTADTADSAAKALDGGGYAAATETGDSYFVYAGIAGDRESARILENKLKASRFDVYAKEYKLPALSRVEWNGDTAPLEAYLAETNRVAQMMAGLTLVHLDEESATPLDATSLAAIKKSHQTWTQKAAAVKAGAPESAKPLLQKMDNAVNTAEKSLEAYSKNPSTSLLNQAQANLMACILAEHQLLDAIGG